MNGDILMEFQKLVVTIKYIEQCKQSDDTDLHPEQAKLRQAMLSDMMSTAIKDLVLIGRRARKRHLPIPQELSYWLLDYVAASLYELPEPKEMRDAKKHVLEQDATREHHRYMFYVNEILRGFERGVEEGVAGNTEYQHELHDFVSGCYHSELSAYRYGYLLASKANKVSVSDAKLYFEQHFHKSSSQIGKLFTKHQLNQVIKQGNLRMQGVKE